MKTAKMFWNWKFIFFKVKVHPTLNVIVMRAFVEKSKKASLLFFGLPNWPKMHFFIFLQFSGDVLCTLTFRTWFDDQIKNCISSNKLRVQNQNVKIFCGFFYFYFFVENKMKTCWQVKVKNRTFLFWIFIFWGDKLSIYALPPSSCFLC